MSQGTEIPVPGVHSMEHTADVALEVTADEVSDLFERSALGMMFLLLERVPEDRSDTRSLQVRATDLPGLLREWLRELLFWHETEGFSVASCGIRIEPHPERSSGAGAEGRTAPDDGTEDHIRLEATVQGGFDRGTPVREIKGVTLHGLVAEARDDGWYGRVIFDV